MTSLSQTQDAQSRVDSLLKRGIVFSIVWLGGIGSLIAVVSGIKARKLINQSDGKLSGMGRVWWCLILGGIGILIWLPIVVIILINLSAGSS